ncbi:MAG: hypothetical protein PHQ58_04460 [Rhodoferax sp.]|uniref:hypothetical protein n=1 Tax=Rhodoferax sp. TaxID=50421 RepID=UPI00261EED98|nr:hypothetical protein [Rhodoferax sp.]MDD2879668.1 hypothetical protein [Rhodoferax sp.]
MTIKIMSFSLPGRVLSLEEFSQLNQSIDNATLEIQENRDAQEQRNSSVEEAVQIADTLDQMSEHIGQAQQLNPNEAQVIDIAVEHFCKRLGYVSKQTVGLEGHVSNTHRISVSLEGIISSIWEAIKAVFRKLKEWIVAAWEAIFGKSEKVATKTVAVQEQRDRVNKTIPESAQNQTSEKINSQIKDTVTKVAPTKAVPAKAVPTKEATEQTTFSERLSRYFRKEDGSGCHSPKEIQDKTEKLLDNLSSGKHSENFNKLGENIDNVTKIVDKFFDKLDEVSECIKAGDKKKYEDELELFEKTALDTYKEVSPLNDGTILDNPFDHHFRIAGKNPAFTMVEKEHFKELTRSSTLELPPKDFKDKVLFSVVKLGETEGKGKNKKILDANKRMLDHVDKRIDQSTKLYNTALSNTHDGTSHDLKVSIFGMLITTETSRLRNAIRMVMELQRTYVEYYITLMNNLIEYVRLSDSILINEYGESTVVI